MSEQEALRLASEARARAEKATEGPWTSHPPDQPVFDSYNVRMKDQRLVYIIAQVTRGTMQDVPALCAALEAAVKREARLATVLARVKVTVRDVRTGINERTHGRYADMQMMAAVLGQAIRDIDAALSAPAGPGEGANAEGEG